MGEPLTPEQARTVELSRNPFKRHNQVIGYIGDMGLRVTGFNEPFIGMVGGRSELIRLAETRVRVKQLVGQIVELDNVQIDAQGEIHGEDI